MSDTTWLEPAFRAYLESPLKANSALALCEALDATGLNDEKLALQRLLDDGPGIWYAITTGPWTDRRYAAGSVPPKDAEAGDLWFDPVEVAFQILVPNQYRPTPDRHQWLSIRPVAVWQFRVFLRLVDARRGRIEFPFPSDLLAPERFDAQQPLRPVTNLYHDEACAYAYWFGKVLSGQVLLQSAKKSLLPKEFERILPHDLQLWEGALHPDSEFVRIVVGPETVDHSYTAELQLRNTDQGPATTNRMVYEEWDRDATIGFSTRLDARSGPMKGRPPHTMFVTLLNVAPRL